MSAYDRYLSAPYNQPEPPNVDSDHEARAIRRLVDGERRVYLIDAMLDEGFIHDYLADAIAAETPAQFAKACGQFRAMFEMLHPTTIRDAAQEIACEDVQDSRDAAAEHAGDCARDAA